MDHLVYVDTNARELEKLLDGDKSMIMRGLAGRVAPYGMVDLGDMLYLIRNNAGGVIEAKARVTRVYNSKRLSREESVDLILRFQDKLQLNRKQLMRWGGKRYLVLIEVDEIQRLSPIRIDRSGFSGVHDWLPINNINSIKVPI